MSKNKIALIDVDEVLLPSFDAWFSWLLEQAAYWNGNCKKQLTDDKIKFISSRYNMGTLFTPYLPEEVDPLSFWDNDRLYDDMLPMEFAHHGLSLLKENGFDLYIVSYVIGNHFSSKQRFIERHFGDLIPKNNFIATSAKHLVHGDLLIDDRLCNLAKCTEIDPKRVQVLFNTKYNQFIDHRPDVVMNGWKDIDKVLELF